MKLSFAIIAASALALAAVPANAATCGAKSGRNTVALVELYTSEGCDSCPPVDKWLSALKGNQAYSGRAVPLSMHVDYWDYIGWRDPYAQAQFGARQREISGINRERTVYTPQILVAGRDLRPGMFSTASGFDEALAKINRMPPRADLGLNIQGASASELKLDATAKLKNTSEAGDAVLYLAVFENGLSSSVAAGENKGKLLKHDFVVRQWLGPLAFAGDGTLALTRAIPLQAAWKKQELGIAMFVQNRSTGEVLQALQLAACN
jgi:hypothetical protein